MPKVPVYKTDGKKSGEITLKDEVFGAPVNASVIHEVVVAHLAKLRQGTQSALTRSEVSGGGIKPFRQKGTGRARQGSIRAPQMTKGGVVFAPKPRDYAIKVNKKAKKLAMVSALSMKVQEGEMIVIDELKLAESKTKEMVKVLSNLKVDKKVLIVMDEKDDGVIRASGNLQKGKNNACLYDQCIRRRELREVHRYKNAVKAIEEGLA